MRRLIILAALAAAVIAGTVPAVADTAQPRVVSDNPVDFTPQVQNGTVYALALVGHTVIVGGDFTQVANADESLLYNRRFLFAYDLTTGAITNFAPGLNGPVKALAAGPNNTVYVGGRFSTVNGVARAGVAQLDVASGARVASFGATIGSGDVRALAYSRGWLYVGGSFGIMNKQQRTALARVNGQTGALDPGLNLGLSAPQAAVTKVDKIAVSPDGSRLIAIGAIESAAGQPRAQLVMVDTGTGTLANWYTNAYASACYSAYDTYLRGVDFSPAGDYFVVVATGKLTGPGRMCDSAARFETGGTGAHQPTWVNYTGGNSLFAVDVTGPAVYVGGHQQWLDNPYGDKNAGPGAVSRPGIGAIDPVSGHALAWNPTRSRGVGVQAFLSTPSGLIVGSDTDQLGHEYHARLGMFPQS
jgi:hypothetical protein